MRSGWDGSEDGAGLSVEERTVWPNLATIDSVVDVAAGEELSWWVVTLVVACRSREERQGSTPADHEAADVAWLCVSVGCIDDGSE